jgi:hypothetical protein
MPALIDAIVPILMLLQHRTGMKTQALPIAIIFSPRQRTLTSTLRIMGLKDTLGIPACNGASP